MTGNHQLSYKRGFAMAVSIFLAGSSIVASEAPPTCESQPATWYFPNSCVDRCKELGSSMDLDRSRNVNGLQKCYCVDVDQPFCTDTPTCADLGIFPSTVEEDCKDVCEADNVDASVIVDYNGYQFHYVVSCACGNGAVKKCGADYVLFSDEDYMQSCSGDGPNSLEITTSDACADYCESTNVFDNGYAFSDVPGSISCSCIHSSIRNIDASETIFEALACDDATARFNDGSGLGNPCYAEVGVTSADCPESAAPSSENSNSVTKTLVSSGAIMGAYLLPW